MTKNYLPTIASGDGGFSLYLQEINKIPSLTEEEELELAKKFYHNADRESAQKLILSHLKLVAKVAMRFKGYGLPVVDLVAEGNIGLMQAVKKFDHTKGFRLSTYAMWWIKASIQEYILRSWSLVKIGTTAAQKKIFFNLSKIKRKIQSLTMREFQHQDFAIAAKELSVSESEIKSMNVRMNQDYSLDQPLADDSNSTHLENIKSNFEDAEQILASNQQNSIRHNLLSNALKMLNPREADIIQKRRLSETPETLDTLSQKYGVSKERVRQIEEAAIKKMRVAMIAS